MASITSWQGGRLNSGLGWTTAFAAGDAGTLANGATVLSSTTAFTNGTSLDQFADISFSMTLSSSAIAANANIAFWIYAQNQDGTTFGDGQLTAGTPATSYTPSFAPCGIFGLPIKTLTTLVGLVQGIVIPPGTFAFAVQNNCGFTLTAATIKYRSYNIRVDNAS